MRANPNLKTFVGTSKAFILLTEGPNYNILDWMSNKHKYNLDVKVQLNKGTYRAEIWKNIIFQIMYTLVVLEHDKISIVDFGYENIWIKEVNPVGYWLYIVDGVKYYLPNTGYLVMLDMGYTEENKYRVLNKAYGDTIIENDSFKKFTDPNFFAQNLKNINIKPPPEDIIRLLGSSSAKGPMDYITQHMTGFLHNRIGTYINHTESKTINLDDTVAPGNLSRGELVVIQDAAGGSGYTWGACIEANGSEWKCFFKQKPKDSDGIITLGDIPLSRIRKYYNEFEPDQRQTATLYPPTCDFMTNPLETYNFKV